MRTCTYTYSVYIYIYMSSFFVIYIYILASVYTHELANVNSHVPIVCVCVLPDLGFASRFPNGAISSLQFPRVRRLHGATHRSLALWADGLWKNPG